MDHNSIDIHDDEEIIEVIDLPDTEPGPDNLADDLEDVDFEDGGDGEETEDWETEDGMEAEEEHDDSEFTFSKHTGSVFCIGLDPVTNTLAVTGGEDDKGYVWRLSDGEVLFECTGHKDSVTCACFSHDSMMVASGDMSGIIKVWKVESKEEVWSIEVGDLEWMEWHPSAPVLLAGTNDGTMWMWKIPGGDCKTFSSAACHITGKILPDGKRAVVGYEDGSVRIWDLKQGNTIHTIKGHEGHKGAVTCLASNKDGSLVLSGSVDGFANMINTTTGKVLCMFHADGLKGTASADKENTNSVESVAFCNTLPLLAVAYLDGTLAIYDLATSALRHRFKDKAGIVQMLWEESSSLVTTSGLDGRLRQWDGLTGVLVSEYSGHTGEILAFALNRESTTAVTASGDHKAKIFCLQRPDR